FGDLFRQYLIKIMYRHVLIHIVLLIEQDQQHLLHFQIFVPLLHVHFEYLNKKLFYYAYYPSNNCFSVIFPSYKAFPTMAPYIVSRRKFCTSFFVVTTPDTITSIVVAS